VNGFVNALTGIFDQLNPFNVGNLVIYFAWLVVFTFTTIAIWRADRAWIRLFCYAVNQVFSIGIVLSWTLTSLLAYTYWKASIGAVVASAVVAFFVFADRGRRRPEED
jgi:presenilin-like A22 family membrane protease